LNRGSEQILPIDFQDVGAVLVDQDWSTNRLANFKEESWRGSVVLKVLLKGKQ